MTGAINVRFFFFGSFCKRVVRGAFSLTLTCRTILPLSFGGKFQCIHVYPSSSARLEFVQWSSSRHSFVKMLWRTSPKQVTVFRANMRAVIRFNCKRNWFIARPWRGEKTALLLFFVVHLFDLRVRSHHSHCLSHAFFFFGAKSYQENFPAVWLTAKHMRGVWTPRSRSWVKHRRKHRSSLPPPPFFLYSTTPYIVREVLSLRERERERERERGGD